MNIPEKLPAHVTIIMDGNGRWARQRGKDRLTGHMEGIESVRAVVSASRELGIKYLSVFAFSEENWNRPIAEVGGLMKLMVRAIKKECAGFVKNGVRMLVVGNRDRLPAEVLEAIREMEDATAACTGMTLVVFMSYSGKWDIQQAARRMAEAGGDDIEPFLATAGIPDPDLMIRTSGEKRISNFMLWQTAYTEFVFVDTLWPDFRKEEFLAALEEFASRDRRFGKVK